MPLDVTKREIVNQIAQDHGFRPQQLWLENGHVWRRQADGWQRCLCAVDTPYWNEQRAAALTSKLIQKLSLR